jgi:hypothetical protein
MYQPGTEAVPSFKLVKRLGRGNFGEVWLATAPGGTRVALKIIRLDTKGEREFYSLRLVKQIRHPNLMPIIAFWLKDEDGNIIADAGSERAPVVTNSLTETAVAPAVDTRVTADYQTPAELLVAMGLGDCSLYDRLLVCQKQGLPGIPVDELLDYIDGAAQAIDHLNSPIHDLGSGPVAIQHRDVKPQNILIVGGAAQVCDYGLARSADDVRHTSSLSAAYAAPECFAGDVSAATDQYALAMSYFELRTGELPFTDTSLMGVVMQKREGTLDLSKLSEHERAVVQRATAVAPADRYPNCRTFVKELRDAVRGERPRVLQTKWIALAALLFVAAMAGILYMLWRPPLVLPAGTAPDEGAAIIEIGGNRYYDRIVRTLPDGTPVRFLLIPAEPGEEPATFYIMENKVSNRMFEQFATAEPEVVKDSSWREGAAMDGKPTGMKDLDWPVFRTTAREAWEFARWMGGRLPSARQWEKAAGLQPTNDSPGPYVATWESTSKTEIAVNRRLEGPLPVGTATKDVSPSGCRDMAGNGYEWTRTLMVPQSGYVPREFPDVKEGDMVLMRGQSYSNDEPLQYDWLKDTHFDQPQDPTQGLDELSFRVVIDVFD